MVQDTYDVLNKLALTQRLGKAGADIIVRHGSRNMKGIK